MPKNSRKRPSLSIDSLCEEQLQLIQLEKEKLRLEMEVHEKKKELIMAKRRRLEQKVVIYDDGRSFAHLE